MCGDGPRRKTTDVRAGPLAERLFGGAVLNGPVLTMVEMEWQGLLLRPWRDADAPVVLRGLTDPEFRRWNTTKSSFTDEADALRYVQERTRGWRRGDLASFAVLEDGAVLGSVALNRLDWWMRSGRASYWTLPEARGRRVASRALEACSRWALCELGLHRLELGHAIGNTASCAVARNCSYALEGTLRGAMLDPDGGFREMHLHARVADDRPA